MFSDSHLPPQKVFGCIGPNNNNNNNNNKNNNNDHNHNDNENENENDTSPCILACQLQKSIHRGCQNTLVGPARMGPRSQRLWGLNIIHPSGSYLEDHPMTCKWLITMVIVSPVRIGLFPWPFHGILNGGDPNHVSKSWDDPPGWYSGEIMFDGVWYDSVLAQKLGGWW